MPKPKSRPRSRQSAEYQELNAVEKLEALYQAGFVEIQEGAAWPIMVRYLDKRHGTPLTDLWAFQPYTQGPVWGDDKGIDDNVKRAWPIRESSNSAMTCSAVMARSSRPHVPTTGALSSASRRDDRRRPRPRGDCSITRLSLPSV